MRGGRKKCEAGRLADYTPGETLRSMISYQGKHCVLCSVLFMFYCISWFDFLPLLLVLCFTLCSSVISILIECRGFQFDDDIYLAVNGDRSESEAYLQHKLTMLYDIHQFLYASQVTG